MDIITVLKIGIALIIFVMFLLVVFYLYLIRPQSTGNGDIIKSPDGDGKLDDKKPIENYGRFQNVLTPNSIFDFMEFDEIVDNMIIRRNKTQYIMILQCNGVNYDLMSEDEKLSIEQGFMQFLNTLRFPIQLYVQSRTLNLDEIIDEYNEKIKAISEDVEKVKIKINQNRRLEDADQREMLEFEKRRKENVLEYGEDLTEYIGRLNANSNILQQKTYLVVSYYISELGENLENYSKDEINNMCFSELYTRAQNVASALASSQVVSRILNSEELAELLYVAYNRDESEVYSLSKALEAEYDSLYSTGKDVLLKKQEKLDKEINIAAIDLATNSILKAEKQKDLEEIEYEMNKDKKVKEKANDLLDMYEDKLDPRIYEIAKEKVEKYDGTKKTKKKVAEIAGGEEKEKEKVLVKVKKKKKLKKIDE